MIEEVQIWTVEYKIVKLADTLHSVLAGTLQEEGISAFRSDLIDAVKAKQRMFTSKVVGCNEVAATTTSKTCTLAGNLDEKDPSGNARFRRHTRSYGLRMWSKSLCCYL